MTNYAKYFYSPSLICLREFSCYLLRWPFTEINTISIWHFKFCIRSFTSDLRPNRKQLLVRELTLRSLRAGIRRQLLPKLWCSATFWVALIRLHNNNNQHQQKNHCREEKIKLEMQRANNWSVRQVSRNWKNIGSANKISSINEKCGMLNAPVKCFLNSQCFMNCARNFFSRGFRLSRFTIFRWLQREEN